MPFVLFEGGQATMTLCRQVGLSLRSVAIYAHDQEHPITVSDQYAFFKLDSDVLFEEGAFSWRSFVWRHSDHHWGTYFQHLRAEKDYPSRDYSLLHNSAITTSGAQSDLYQIWVRFYWESLVDGVCRRLF